MKFRLKPSRTLRGRRWYFTGIGGNGEPIFQSEGYRNKLDAIKTINVIRRNAADAPIDEQC